MTTLEKIQAATAKNAVVKELLDRAGAVLTGPPDQPANLPPAVSSEASAADAEIAGLEASEAERDAAVYLAKAAAASGELNTLLQ